MFIHVPNTLDPTKIDTIATCALDLLQTYFEGSLHVADESRRLAEIDDSRMTALGPFRWLWAGMAAGGWLLLTRS